MQVRSQTQPRIPGLNLPNLLYGFGAPLGAVTVEAAYRPPEHRSQKKLKVLKEKKKLKKKKKKKKKKKVRTGEREGSQKLIFNYLGK